MRSLSIESNLASVGICRLRKICFPTLHILQADSVRLAMAHVAREAAFRIGAAVSLSGLGQCASAKICKHGVCRKEESNIVFQAAS